MSDNLHYNSQRDKDMDARLSHPIEEKIVCKHCQAEYWESESHECKPIDVVNSGLDRMLAQSDKITAVMNDGNVSIDKLVKRNAVLEKALEMIIDELTAMAYEPIPEQEKNIDYWVKQAEEQCKSK